MAAMHAVVRWFSIGQFLNRKKQECGHGDWLPWLQENIRFSQEQASAYMRLDSNRSKLVTITNFGELTQKQLLALYKPERKPRAVNLKPGPEPKPKSESEPKTVDVDVEVVKSELEPEDSTTGPFEAEILNTAAYKLAQHYTDETSKLLSSIVGKANKLIPEVRNYVMAAVNLRLKRFLEEYTDKKCEEPEPAKPAEVVLPMPVEKMTANQMKRNGVHEYKGEYRGYKFVIEPYWDSSAYYKFTVKFDDNRLNELRGFGASRKLQRVIDDAVKYIDAYVNVNAVKDEPEVTDPVASSLTGTDEERAAILARHNAWYGTEAA